MKILARRRILFVIPSLSGGGAERVVLTLAKNIPRDVFDVSLAIVNKEGPYEQEIPQDIEVFDLHCRRVRYAFPRLVQLIRHVHPDVVFSTLGYLNIALLILRPFLPRGIKLVVRESNTVSNMLRYYQFSAVWNLSYRHFYPQADLIISQSSYMREDLIDNFAIPAYKIKTIYNPVDFNRITVIAQEKNPYPKESNINIVWVGRLVTSKAIHRIIESMPDLLQKQPDAHLWIIGDGPLKKELLALCHKLNIFKRVHFIGFDPNPYPWMRHADLMVLSSVYEGLPNVLLEAIACQCPVISLEHPGGTQEIMELTCQPERYVSELTWEDWWFNRPSAETLLNLKAHFGLDHIVQRYTDILQNI